MLKIILFINSCIIWSFKIAIKNEYLAYEYDLSYFSVKFLQPYILKTFETWTECQQDYKLNEQVSLVSNRVALKEETCGFIKCWTMRSTSKRVLLDDDMLQRK